MSDVVKNRLRAGAILPPPPSFSLAALADDTLLSQYEVAQVMRQSLSWTEKRRLAGTDKLEWVYLGNRPRCVARSLKKRIAAGSPNKGPQDARLSKNKVPVAKPKRTRIRADRETVGV